MRLILSALALLVAVVASAQGVGRGSPSAPVDAWPMADPAALGLDTTALAEHAALCEASAATACLVAVGGHIVQEWTAPDYRYGPFLGLASATKSLTALVAGRLLEEGRLGGVNVPVAHVLPGWRAGAEAGVTLDHLLTMTSGLGRLRPPESVLAAANTTAFVLGLAPETAPGERWQYSNEGAQLLAPLLERAAGMPLAAYARERLFDPIGARTLRFDVDEYGNTVTFGGAEGTLRDVARVPQLVLNDGVWNGRRLLPAGWADSLAAPTPANPYYGRLWWREDGGDALWAAGDGDRILLAVPSLDLVAVRLQRTGTVPGTATASYFNDRGRMHADALAILRRVVPAR